MLRILIALVLYGLAVIGICVCALLVLLTWPWLVDDDPLKGEHDSW